jgi:SAM-dependent MidA family methyltransferase
MLLDAIRAEIREVGPITFARFMEVALYDPTRGYYRSPSARPGRAGDFLTAPEAHPIFGRALARFAAGVHAALGGPSTFVIRESGAGEGALAAPLVEALLRGSATGGGVGAAGTPPPRNVRYLVDEVEPRRVEAVHDRLATLGLPPGTVSATADEGAPITGLAIANEVLDALPTHRVVVRSGELREVCVGIGDDGELVDVETEPTTPAISARLAGEGIVLRDDQRAEVCLAVDAWVARASAGLERGVLLLIDYGHPAADLYDGNRRAAGTLAAYRGHRVGDDPYRSIGRQDLTAHVDVTAVERAAMAAGLDRLAVTTQDSFLARLGVGKLLVAEQTRPGASMQSYLEARSALLRMIDPAAMGRFRVLVFGRGVAMDSDIPGLRPVVEPADAEATPGATESGAPATTSEAPETAD